MKVLTLSTYMTGGAANCAVQLGKAFNKHEKSISNKLLVRKGQEDSWIHTLSGTYKIKGKFAFYFEKLLFLKHEKNQSVRWAFSIGNLGVDISQHPLVQEADIIHIHWINQGFLSIDSIKKLVATGKPIVWSMHDMWIFTGGCHYAGECTNFTKVCGNCNFLKTKGVNDISTKILKNKIGVFANSNINYVASSKWLKKEGLKSSLLKNENIIDLPTPVDTDLFKPLNKAQIRTDLGIGSNKKIILFLAMSAMDKRKGFAYLLEALKHLSKENNSSKYEVLVVGESDPSLFSEIKMKFHHLGLIREKQKIVEAYNAAGVFVIPSLEDNLPNTIMESLACGTPCVGFETGGIPEMIDHKINGYITDFKNSKGLAEGISWVLNEVELSESEMKKNALEKAISTYSYPVVAEKYLKLYASLLTEKDN